LSDRVRSLVRDWRRALRLFWYRSSGGARVGVALGAGASLVFGVAVYSHFSNHADHESLNCLALNVYFEARGESRAGQLAVAEVTMNRVRSGRYPGNVCAVVYQKNWDPLRRRYVGAFSWTEFDRVPTPRGIEWERAWRVAEIVYYHRHEPLVADAVLYHSVRIRPSWSLDRRPVARIGRHVFYR
jgi:N-acetylmuramoyl-L-alanine amidase